MRHASPAERLNKVLLVLAVRSITGMLLGGSCANWVKLFGAVTRISLPFRPPPPALSPPQNRPIPPQKILSRHSAARISPSRSNLTSN
jgi:hypothetical protein